MKDNRTRELAHKLYERRSYYGIYVSQENDWYDAEHMLKTMTDEQIEARLNNVLLDFASEYEEDPYEEDYECHEC
jgi:hypothetical protein